MCQQNIRTKEIHNCILKIAKCFHYMFATFPPFFTVTIRYNTIPNLIYNVLFSGQNYLCCKSPPTYSTWYRIEIIIALVMSLLCYCRRIVLNGIEPQNQIFPLFSSHANANTSETILNCYIVVLRLPYLVHLNRRTVCLCICWLMDARA